MKYITLLSLLLLWHMPTHSQVIVTAAGTGSPTYGGDGGPATAAQLQNPYGVTLDKDGNLYICDQVNWRVRKVSPAYGGTIATIAGNGTPGYSGDGIDGKYANIRGVYDVAVDKKGNAYLADAGNHRIRKVSASGIITTYAGTGTAGYNGDGIAATSAMLSEPIGICIDDTGNIFVADRFNRRIRKIDTFGIITTIAGNSAAGYAADGALAGTASLDEVWCVRVDRFGTVFFTDNRRLRKITTAGTLLTVAGNGTLGDAGDGGPALAAELLVSAFAIDDGGNIYIADGGACRVRKIEADGVITAFAGNGAGGYSGDWGNPLMARLHTCGGIAVAPNGDVYIGDVGNHRVRLVTTHLVGITGPEAGTDGLSVFPNPASGAVTVVLTEATGIEAEATVVAVDGRVMDSFCLRANAPLHLSTPWPAGNYVINITAGSRKLSKVITVR